MNDYSKMIVTLTPLLDAFEKAYHEWLERVLPQGWDMIERNIMGVASVPNMFSFDKERVKHLRDAVSLAHSKCHTERQIEAWRELFPKLSDPPVSLEEGIRQFHEIDKLIRSDSASTPPEIIKEVIEHPYLLKLASQQTQALSINTKHVSGWDPTGTGQFLIRESIAPPKIIMKGLEVTPEGSKFLFNFLSCPIGEYGEYFPVVLTMVGAIMNEICDCDEQVHEASREIYRKNPEMVKRMARFRDNDSSDLTPLRTFREAIQSMVVMGGLLTARKVDGFDDPCLLLGETFNQGLHEKMARQFPPTIIGPLGLMGAYLKNLLINTNGSIEINPDYVGEFMTIQESFRKRKPLFVSGRGCPMAYHLKDEKNSVVRRLANIFMLLVLQVDIILPHYKQKEKVPLKKISLT